MKISQIIEAIHEHRIRISDHADVEAHEDRLSYEDVYHSVLITVYRPDPTQWINWTERRKE